MNILVTGGAGFIGSHLCDALLAAGHRVTALDNCLTGSASNVEHLRDHPEFRLVTHDVIEPYSGPGSEDVEAIFHLASPASPVGYRTYAIETLLVNSAGTVNMLRLATERGARFLVTSTSEVYGDPLVHPQKEDYWGNVNPIGLRACYDEAKRFAEAATMEWIRQYDVDARIIRIFNTYGPRNQLDDGRVVPNFIVQALRGEPITIYGDGSQTRSFQYVSDLVAGIQRAMFTEGTKAEVFNLGNPVEFTILQFAQEVLAVTGSASVLERRPLLFEDDPARRRPDISKAKARLDWEPQVPLRQGLETTVAWYRTQI
ncbi:MAG: NAD-dependent epimerase/dehydratase [Armatimonadetes bacterium]|jgi:nucleoside-diphosphate-sugar epimerase|nr:NAD-dependent epimerase/dehydratase [Armatimonadota bacterium]